jgi:cytochrome c oxidase subunit I+III
LTEPMQNPWDAGTLEWMPNGLYGPRSIPIIVTAYPLWQQPNLVEEVQAGRYYLPNAPTGERETIITSPVEATPQYVQRLAGPGWSPLAAALFTAAFFMLLTVKLYAVALTCGVLAVAFILFWLWGSDAEPVGEVDAGCGLRLPTYVSGPVSHAWWSVVTLMLVAGSLYLAYVFSYLYIWTVSPQQWQQNFPALPAARWHFFSAGMLALAGIFTAAASRILSRSLAAFAVLVLLAIAAMSASLVVEFYAHWTSGLRPDASAYGALTYLASALQLEIVGAIVIIGFYVVARVLAGRLGAVHRVTFDVFMLLTYYAIGQGFLGLLLVHGFPRTVT